MMVVVEVSEVPPMAVAAEVTVDGEWSMCIRAVGMEAEEEHYLSYSNLIVRAR